MTETRRRFDEDFRQGAVRIVRETGKPIAELAMQRDVLIALRGPLGERGDGPVSVAGFIVSQRARHQIPHAVACRALGVSPAWFYKWRHGDPSPRRARRVQLTAKIKQLFAARRS